MQAFIDLLVANSGVIAMIGLPIADLIFRLIPSQKPRSIVRLVISLLTVIADLLDKIVPDKQA